jgi:LysM repeat protein
VVLFPRDYLAYLESSSGIDVLAEQLEQATYEVRRGDSLWKIAQRHGTTVDQIRTANRLPSISIRPGQMLEIPAR